MDKKSLELETFTSLKKVAKELGINNISHLRAKDKDELIKLILLASKRSKSSPSRSRASSTLPESSKVYTKEFLKTKTLNELRRLARLIDEFDTDRPNTTAKKSQLINYIYNNRYNDQKTYQEKLRKESEAWSRYERTPSPRPSSSQRYKTPPKSRSPSPQPSSSRKYKTPVSFENFYENPTREQCNAVLCPKGIRNAKDYRLWALHNFPDKVPINERDEATVRFKEVSNCVGKNIFCSKGLKSGKTYS